MSYTFKIYRKRFKILWKLAGTIHEYSSDNRDIFPGFRMDIPSLNLKDGRYRVVSDYTNPIIMLVKDGTMATWTYDSSYKGGKIYT